MKKWERNYIITIVGLILLICAISAFIIFSNGYKDEQVTNFIKYPIVIVCLLVVFAVLGYLGINLFITTKIGAQNIKTCGDDLFENIDKYKKGVGEGFGRCERQIQIINFYYKEGGKVDELVYNKEIHRLYARFDYLVVQNSIYDHFITYFYSLIISVIASFVCQMMEMNNIIHIFMWVVVIVISFFVTLLSRYAERGQAGSYRYMVDEYEKKLLLKKIEKLENSITISEDDEECLETKQNVINELLKIREKSRNKKAKKQVVNDIETIESLNLCLGDYTGCHKEKVYINKHICCMVYDEEKGKENNYIGEINLKTRDYSIMYEILKKYELISYIEK